jgi:glutamyl-tRNA synthetase
VDEFIARCAPWVPDAWRTTDVFAALAPLVQERVKRLDEVPAMIDFMFVDDVPVDEPSWNKAMKSPADAVLDGVIAAYETSDWDGPSLKLAAEAVGEQHGLKPSKAQAPVRVAITGRTVGPPLYDSIALLGRERTLARLRSARARLAG